MLQNNYLTERKQEKMEKFHSRPRTQQRHVKSEIFDFLLSVNIDSVSLLSFLPRIKDYVCVQTKYNAVIQHAVDNVVKTPPTCKCMQAWHVTKKSQRDTVFSS